MTMTMIDERRVRVFADRGTRARRSRDRVQVQVEAAHSAGAERSTTQDRAARAGGTKEHAGSYADEEPREGVQRHQKLLQ